MVSHDVIGDLGWAHDAGVEAHGAERCGYQLQLGATTSALGAVPC